VWSPKSADGVCLAPVQLRLRQHRLPPRQGARQRPTRRRQSCDGSPAWTSPAYQCQGLATASLRLPGGPRLPDVSLSPPSLLIARRGSWLSTSQAGKRVMAPKIIPKINNTFYGNSGNQHAASRGKRRLFVRRARGRSLAGS
jgi:hypothetical protein